MAAETPDDLLAATALKLLEAGPMPAATLFRRLRELGRLDHLVAEVVDEEDLEAAAGDVVLDTDALWSTPDGIVASTALLIDGLVLTHRLTGTERADGEVRCQPDLVILDWDAHDGLALVGGGRIEHRFGVHVPGHDLSTFGGPDGWLDRFSPGQLLAFTRRGETVEVTAATEPDDDAHEVELLRAAAEARIEPGTGEEVVPVVLDALVADPTSFRRPVRPLDELMASAGFVRRGFSFGRAGEPWKSYGEPTVENAPVRRARRWGFDACCERAFGTVEEAFDRSTTGPLDDVDVEAVAEALAHGDVAEAFADHVLGYAHGIGDRRLVTFASAVITRTRRQVAPARFLIALEADARRDVLYAERQLREAFRADPDFGPVAMALASCEIDRGNVDRAITLLHHHDVRPDASSLDFLEHFRARVAARHRGVGRNDPCPCGSRRKFKACCIGDAAVPLAARTKFLALKLARFARDRLRSRRVGVASSACDPDDPELQDRIASMACDPFITDIVLFEGGGAELYLDQRGALLPDDERALLERLLDEPRRLWEVVDVDPGSSLTMRDTLTGERLVVTEATASRDRRMGEYLLTRVARLAGDNQLFGMALAVPLRLRETTLELVDADPDADELADWYGAAMAPPRVVTRENEPFVVCRAELATDAPLPDLHATLDPVLEREDEGRWVETWELPDGETVLRGTVRYEGGRLHVETNSEARLERLLDLLDGAVPDAQVVADEREDAADLVRRRRDVPLPPPEESPELRAALDDYVRHRERQWVDEPVPALGGLTPRQARDDPTRREDLLTLLREAEVHADHGGQGFDPARLRRLLGLDGQ